MTVKHTDEERQLVEAATRGEPGAFDRLATRFEPGLRSFLKGRLRARPDVEVDDVIQDVRLYVFQRLDRYDPHYPFEVFVRALAKQVAKRHLYGKALGAPDLCEYSEDDDLPRQDLSPVELSKLPLSFGFAMGLDRFDHPDGGVAVSREFLDLFELFTRYGGYPHQQVAFGFSILLWGKPKREGRTPATREVKVPVTGDPDRVVREVGPQVLAESSERMFEDTQAVLRLDDEYIARVWQPIGSRLSMTAAELFGADRRTFRHHAHLADQITGETKLDEYCGPNKSKSVADWTRAVKERIRKLYLDPASRSKLELPL